MTKNKGGAMNKIGEYIFWVSIFGLIASVFFDSRNMEILFSVLLFIYFIVRIIRNIKRKE